MSLKKIMVAFVALLIAQPAFAEDHLEPEDSIFTRWYDEEFDRYETIVVSKLREVFGYGYLARAIVIPSFETEYAVALNEQGGQYSLLYLKPETHLWLYEVLRDYESGLVTSRDHDGNDTTAKDLQELREQLSARRREVGALRSVSGHDYAFNCWRYGKRRWVKRVTRTKENSDSTALYQPALITIDGPGRGGRWT